MSGFQSVDYEPELPFSILNRISTDSGRFANAEVRYGSKSKELSIGAALLRPLHLQQAMARFSCVSAPPVEKSLDVIDHRARFVLRAHFSSCKR
jgi:hypothetical protein